MGAANTIPQLRECVRKAIEEVQPSDEPLRRLLEAVASVASSSDSSEALTPSVKALGRFAVDELTSEHPLSRRVDEILGIYQAVVRAERKEKR